MPQDYQTDTVCLLTDTSKMTAYAGKIFFEHFSHFTALSPLFSCRPPHADKCSVGFLHRLVSVSIGIVYNFKIFEVKHDIARVVWPG